MNSLVLRTLVVLIALKTIAASLVSTPYNQQPWRLTATGKPVYNKEQDVTTFFYNIRIPVAGPDQFDLRRWVLQASGSCTGYKQVPSPVQRWTPFGLEVESNTNGFTWQDGQEKEQSLDYTISFAGRVGVGSISFTLIAGNEVTSSTVMGPACDVDTSGWTFPQVPNAPSGDLECSAPEVGPLLAPGNGVTVLQIPTVCNDTYTLRRTHSKEDPTIILEDSVVVSVVDSQAPTFVDNSTYPLPQRQLKFECNNTGAIPNPADVRAVDNCDSVVHVDLCDDRLDGRCDQNYFLLRTWTAWDNCGNSVCHTQTIIVEDTQPPKFTNLPNDKTVECHLATADDRKREDPTISDDCDLNFNQTYHEAHITGECTKEYKLRRTWSAWDHCGNLRVHTQHIHFEDNTPPVLTPDSVNDTTVDVSQNCTLPDDVVVTGLDECDTTEFIQVNKTDKRTNGSCEDQYTVRRTWTATDSCGNPASVAHTLTVNDKTKPVITLADPDDKTYYSCTFPGQANPVSVTDNCDPNVENRDKNESRTDTACDFEYSLTRKWFATDRCGNPTSVVQTVTVIDNTPPVISGDYDDPSKQGPYDCQSPPTCADFTVTAVDTCGQLTQTYTPSCSSQLSDGNCADNKTITFTWTVSDCAQNSAVPVVRSYKIHDVTDPTFDAPLPPLTRTDECQLQAADPVVTSDNCANNNPVLSNNTVGPFGTCLANFTHTYTWTVTDDCSNFATRDQVVTVEDTVAPTLSVPVSVTVQCDAIPNPADPDGPDVTSGDVCTEAYGKVVSVSRSTGTVSNGCKHNYTLTHTYTAEDFCGHKTVKSYDVKVIDTTLPVLDDIPVDVTVACDKIPAIPKICVSDNCDQVDLTFVQTRDPPTGCNYTLTRTWSAEDACSNKVSASQLITVFDNEAPIFNEAIPDRQTVDCVAWFAGSITQDVLTANDSCSAVTVDNDNKTENFNTTCSPLGTVTFTWTASDNCGNDNVKSDTFDVVKDFPPVFSGLNPTRDCECSDLDTCLAGQWPSLSDKCGSNSANWDWCGDNDQRQTGTCSHFTETGSAGECANYTLTRDWEAYDCVGNKATFTQVVTVTDTTKPEWRGNLPQDVTVQCDEVPDAPTLFAVDVGGCSKVDVTLNETRINSTTCDSSYVLSRVWTATDKCGNFITHPQLITVIDTVIPVFNTTVPRNINGSCDNVPPVPGVCGSDNCECVSLNFTSNRNDGNCSGNYTIDRQWILYDLCGNKATMDQTVTITDNTDPYWTTSPLPASHTQECTYTAPNKPVGDDACGVATSTMETTNVPATSLPGVFDCIYNFDKEIQFTLTDECANDIQFNITVEVRDRIDPYFGPSSLPLQNTTGCLPIPGPTTVKGFDDCDTNFPPAGTDETNNFNKENEVRVCPYIVTYTRKWEITDACNNKATLTQDVETHYDASLHQWDSGAFDFKNTVDYERCLTPPADPSPESEDGCGNDITTNVGKNQSRIGTGQCQDYKIDYTFTSTDPCNNTLQETYTRTFTDKTSPQFKSAVTIPDSACVTAFPNQGDKTGLGTQCGTRPGFPRAVKDHCQADWNVDPVVTYAPIGTCKYTFTQTFNWTTADDCGNPLSDTFDVTYGWNKKPSFSSLPTDRPAPCDNVPGPETLTATDACGFPLNVVQNQTIQDLTPQCNNSYDLTYHYYIEDSCGQTNYHNYTVRVRDNEDPKLTGVPADITYECGFQKLTPDTVGCTDNCPGCSVSVNTTTVYNNTCCNYQIKHVWTATDLCGRKVTAEQLVTVEDTLPPRLKVCEDACVECWEEPTCNVTAEQVTANGYCVDVGTTSDECTNTNTDSWTVKFSDGATFDPANNDLVLIRSANGTLFLNGTIGSIAVDLHVTDKVATSNKGPAVSARLEADSLKSVCYTDIETYEIAPTDNWDFYATVTGTITVSGTVYTVSAVGNAQMGLGANGRNKLMGFALDFDLTGGSLTGGSFRVQVDTNPFTTCNIDPWVNQFPILVCDSLPINLTTTRDYLNCTNNDQVRLVITNIWETEDEEGNVARAIQTVTVKDRVAPNITFDVDPANRTNVDCEDWPLPMPNATATDKCEEGITVTVEPAKYVPSCKTKCCDYDGTHTREWTATDECGNPASVIVDITIVDEDAPDILGTPQDRTIECYEVAQPGNQLANDPVSAVDNCGTGNITRNETRQNTTCSQEYTLTRTFKTEDECGNVNSTSYTLTVVDSFGPYFNSSEPDAYTQCVVPPFAADPLWGDRCNVGSITPSETNSTLFYQNPGACEAQNKTMFIVTRKWVITDECGRDATSSYKVYVQDKVKPTFNQSTLPADVTVECDNIPAVPTVLADDACDNTTITPVYNSVTQPENQRTCLNNYTITRTWTITDHCGNFDTYTQTITVVDRVAPQLSPSPANVTVNCTEIPAIPEVCAEDNCADVTLSYKQDRINQDQVCANRYDIRREWVATDACQHDATVVQIINVVDEIDPVWTNQTARPVDQTVFCKSVPSQDLIPARDDCAGVIPTTKNESKVDLGCKYRYRLDRKWFADDSCGNVISHEASVTVNDTVPPTATAPADEGPVYCHIPTIPTVTPGDDCTDAGDITSTLPDNSDKTLNGCAQNFTIFREWIFRDECNNEHRVNHTVVVIDNQPPTFNTDFPADVTVDCDKIPAVATPTASDDCAGGATVTFLNETKGPELGCKNRYTLTRYWQACDPCQNCIVDFQTIFVNDSTLPVLSGEPSESAITVQCDNVPNPVELCVSDNCNGTTIDFVQTRQNGSCTHRYTLTRDWVGRDDCGNRDTYQRIISVIDTGKPTWNVTHGDTTVLCEDYPNYVQPDSTADDTCDGDVTVTKGTPSITPGSCSSEPTREDFWTATDDCLNSITYSRKVYVVDLNFPTIDQASPAVVYLECGEDYPYPTITGNDPCDGPLTSNLTETRQNTSCANVYNITRTWKVCDCTDHCNTTTQVLVYTDNTDPFFEPGQMPVNNTKYECDNVPSLLQPSDLYAYTTPATVCKTKAAVSHDPNGSFCKGTADPNAPNGRAFHFGPNFNVPGFITHGTLQFVGGSGTLNKYGASKRTLHGFVQSTVNSDVKFEFWIELGAAAPGTPVTNLDASCYVSGSGTIDDTAWEIYPAGSFKNGVLRGVWGSAVAGVYIELTPLTATQFGEGANNMNHNDGVFSSLSWRVAADTEGSWSSATSDDSTLLSGNEASLKLDVEDCRDDLDDRCSHDYQNITTDRVRTNTSCDQEYTLTDTYTITDCSGNSAEWITVYHIQDTVKPNLTITPTPKNETYECKAGTSYTIDPADLPTDSYTASDICDPNPSKNDSTKAIDVSGESKCYKHAEKRTFIAEDCVGNFDYQTYSIYVEDTKKPFFTSTLPPATNTLECDDTYNLNNFEDLNGDDDCDFLVANKTQVRTNGSCDHEYTLTRTWNIYDTCGFKETHVQVVDVIDQYPPSITPPTASCLKPIDFDSYYAIPEYLTKEWTTTDNCGTPTLKFISCTSNQDSFFGTDDCTYDVNSDSLIVRVRTEWTVPEGRLFTITVEAEDTCRNTTRDTTQILIPLDEDSLSYYPNFTFPNCFPVVQDCESSCPCNYNQELECLLEPSKGWEFTAAGVNYDSNLDTTTFDYTINGGFGGPQGAVFGLDANIEVVECSVSGTGTCSLGFAPDMHVGGLVLHTTTLTSFQFVAKGDLSNSLGQVPFQISTQPADMLKFRTTPNFCTKGSVTGPVASARTFSSTNQDIAGHAYIIGTSNSPLAERTARIGIARAEVLLVDRELPFGQSVHTIRSATVSDENGFYLFKGVDASKNYSVVLSREGGVLNVASKFPIGDNYNLGNFLINTFLSFNPVYPYGDPVDATQNTDNNDLFVLLNSQQVFDEPNYFYNGTEYRGNPQHPNYWFYQVHSYEQNEFGLMSISDKDLEAIAVAVKALIPSCFSSTPSTITQIGAALSGTDDQKALFSMALNHVSGRGLFGSLRLVQEWIIAFGESRFCGNNSFSDSQVVSNFFVELLAAN